MAKPKLLTLRQKLKRVTVLLIPFIVATTVLTLRLDTAADDGAPEPNNPRHSRAPAADDAALAQSHAVWWTRGAAGVPFCAGPSSPRTSKRGANTTQPAADDVLAVPRSGDEGERLHRCDACAVHLGRHPSHGYDYSAALLEEAAQWQDVVTLPMNEGRVSPTKKAGVGGPIGTEAEIGMSQRCTCGLTLRSVCFRPRGTLRRAMTTCFFRVPAVRCSPCASCRAEGSTWGFMCEEISGQWPVQ
ncbi:hypothetical protein TcBrA4_0000680 [Trypanosoma cruzi]|nr:hypothetical protein TcBrA4_0000680 [Trypanosoma cruzi]